MNDKNMQPDYINQLEKENKELKAIISALENGDRFVRVLRNTSDLIYRYEYLPDRKFTYISPSVIDFS
jgi:hypothetical protein